MGTALILLLPEVSPLLIWFIACLVLISTVNYLRFSKFKPTVYFTAGLLYALLCCQLQLDEQIKHVTNLEIEARVDSLPKYSSTKVSFISNNTQNHQTYLLSKYINDSADLPEIHVGALYRFSVNLKPPNGTANGVGFDRARWLFRHGIDGIGTIKKMELVNQEKTNINHLINSWRASLSQLIDSNFADTKVNGLIHALSIGDKSRLEHQDHVLFQNTGTAHLIAISGLHIGMVAYIGWLLGAVIYYFWPQQRVSRPVIQVLAGIVFAALYACLAGLAVSTVRALIMLIVLACYKLSRRPSYAWDVWASSLFLVLLIDPFNVLDTGFWLSFSAVAVLIYSFSGTSQTTHAFLNFIKMQWVLLIGMLPLTLSTFSAVKLMAPVVNLFMIPLMTFLLIPVLLFMLIWGSVFSYFPTVLVKIINTLGHLFLEMLNAFNQFSVLSIDLTLSHWWQFILLFLGAMILISPQAIPQRLWGVLFIILAMYTPKTSLPKGHFNAYFLDVGQGLAVYIETQNHQLIYDVGAASESGFNMADATIIPFLKQQHINHLDSLILSHQDNDHAGSAPHLSAQITTGKIWGTEQQHQACISQTHWQWDGVQFTFLSPNNLTPYLKNNSSCVLKIESPKSSLLLTGDIESPVEFRLTQQPNQHINSDVMLIPHHGSKTSSTQSFIHAVDPQVAINSSGQYNRFNHPAPEILARYQQQGITVLDTQHSGLITMSTYPQLNFSEFRRNNPKIWRKKKPE